MEQIENLINGEWVAGQSSVENINPADTNDVIGNAAQGNAANVDHAVHAAREAFPAWREATPQARHDLRNL